MTPNMSEQSEIHSRDENCSGTGDARISVFRAVGEALESDVAKNIALHHAAVKIQALARGRSARNAVLQRAPARFHFEMHSGIIYKFPETDCAVNPT